MNYIFAEKKDQDLNMQRLWHADNSLKSSHYLICKCSPVWIR